MDPLEDARLAGRAAAAGRLEIATTPQSDAPAARDRLPGRWLLWPATAAYAAGFSILSIARHDGFYSLEDVGVFSQMLWATLQGRLFYTDFAGLGRFAFVPHNYLGHHFSPILFLLLPVYALWPEPELLLVIQSVALGVAAIPLYLVVQEHSNSPWLALTLAIAWLVSPYVWQSNIGDFHVDTFEPLFVFSAAHALLKRRPVPYALCILLLLSCKEDTVVSAVAIGLFAIVAGRQVRTGLLTVAGALLWGVATFGLFMPFFGGGFAYADHYSHLGRSLSEIARTIVVRPDKVLAHLAQRPILEAALWLLSAFAFLPLFSLLGVVLVMPGTLMKLLANSPHINSLSWYYSAPVLPFFFLATMTAASNVAGLFRTDGARRRALGVIGSLVLAATVVSGSRLGFGLFGGFTVSLPVPAVSRDGWLWVSKRDAAVRQHLRSIPEGASVSTSPYIVSHVAKRFDVGVYPYRPLDREIILLDIYGQKYPADSTRYKCAIAALLSAWTYGVVHYQDGFLHLRRGHETSRNGAVAAQVASIVEADELYARDVEKVFDLSAGNKLAMFFAPRRAAPAVVYGPYVALPPGRYEVGFRMKVEQRVPGEVARIDVSANRGDRVLAERILRGSDFDQAATYEEVRLGLHTREPLENVEFRAHRTGREGFWVDRINLYPESLALEAVRAACAR